MKNQKRIVILNQIFLQFRIFFWKSYAENLEFISHPTITELRIQINLNFETSCCLLFAMNAICDFQTKHHFKSFFRI